MKYVYYKAKHGNFGDDLNGWLWPRLFGNEDDSDDHLIGIGSIICESNLIKSIKDKKKIVFGSGVRPDYKKFELDDTWDIKFLRGPLSSDYFKGKYEFIADAAYALRLTRDFKDYVNIKKKYPVSIMPYFHSVKYFNWEKIAAELNFHYISPRAELGIEHTLKEIAASELIITEAMHGAIIADLLRIPWHRFVLSTPYNEGSMVSEFKWKDWFHSVKLGCTEATSIKLYRKSKLNSAFNLLTNNVVNIEFVIKKIVRQEILTKLSAVKNYNLSLDGDIKIIDERLSDKIFLLKQETAKPKLLSEKSHGFS